jgi:hypothetical protein
VEGLNELQDEFNDDPSDNYGKGGFYITTLPQIPRFYHLGDHVCEVVLPIHDPNFRIILTNSGTIWRVNKLILGKKYFLNDIDTYKQLNLEMSVKVAFKNDCIDMLNLYPNDVIEETLSDGTILNIASSNGNLNILQHAFEKGLIHECPCGVLLNATISGHIDVLDFWLKTGLTKDWPVTVKEWAIRNGNKEIALWWLNKRD